MGAWVRALAGAAALSLAAFANAAAQDPDPAAQVRGYLDNGMQAHAAHGYRAERGIEDVIVPLGLNSPYLWPLDLRAGVNYRVYGACDNDCSDLDMEVYGPDGHLADRDTAGDDTPYVQITPEVSGRVYVRIWLYACQHEPCTVGARVVSGGAPVARAPAPSAEDSAEPNDDDQPNAGEDGADQNYVGAVRRQLTRAGARHEAAGFASFDQDKIEPVELDGPGYITTIHLDADYDYVFQGACDSDCSDADMEIRDASGMQLALDVEGDNTPSLALTPPRTGDYGLRIWLAQCEVVPCYVGFRSYRRHR